METKRILSFFLAAIMIATTLAAGMTVQAELPFNDTDGHWGVSAIEYVVENGLMNGVGNGESFAPNMSLTRGMVVTVLYRDNGSPKADFKGTFLDVAEGAYYTAAAEWAYEKKIVNGTGTDDWGVPYFSPDRDITRQELATMFKRYADFKHVDTAKGATDIASFPDASSVADWAKDAVKWAVGVGLITGKTNGGAATLSPTDKAVRAEFATIIKRFKEAKFEYLLAYESPVVMSTYTELPYPLVEDADVYVAVDGDDKNPGTLSKPLATFEAAKAKVRELRKTAKDEIKVAFKAGNYGALDNVQFTSEDAGSENIPVTYCKYGDGDVIFSNGTVFSANDFTVISAGEKGMFPAASADKIKKLSIEGMLQDQLQISNYIFNDTDGLIWLARDLNKNALGQDVYYNNVVYGDVNRREALTLTEPMAKKVQSFEKVDGLMFKGMLLCGWVYSRFEAKSFDPETNLLYVYTERDYDLMPDMWEGTIVAHGGFATQGRMTTKIFFYNLPEFMDAQGEYWIDTDTDTLYVYNPHGNYTFCTNGTMMTLNEGADHISFIGLEFNGANETMVYSNSDYITFDRCTFANLGGHYFIRGEGINHFTLINSEMYNFVDGGVYIISDADRANIVPADNVFKNNAFRDFGLSEYWSQAIRIQNDVGCVIEHNEFVNGAHGAIRYDECIDLTIQYNVFDSMMQTTEDYGAIYSIYSTVYRGNVIRYNIFVNISTIGAQTGKSTHGIYVDNYSSGQEIYGNVFYDGGGDAVCLHMGRDNLVHDNIIISTDEDQFLTSFKGMAEYVDNNGNLIDPEAYKSCEWVAFGMVHLPGPGDEGYGKWYDRWPQLFAYHYDTDRIDEDINCAFNVVNYVDNNYCFGTAPFSTGADPNYKYAWTEGEGNMNFTLDENPIFVNPAIGDYRILEDADFHKIPYEKIGRY